MSSLGSLAGGLKPLGAASVYTESPKKSEGAVVPRPAYDSEDIDWKDKTLCAKCRLKIGRLAPTTQAKRNFAKGLVADCACCDAQYKRLTRNWGRDSAWKTWWEEKSEAQKVFWYRAKREIDDDQESHPAKRLKPAVSKSIVKATGHNEGIEVQWKPWAVMRRDLLVEGWSADGAQQEWRRRCMDPAWKSRKINGQWCFCEFQGMREMVYRGVSNQSSATIEHDGMTGDELKSMLSECDEMAAKEHLSVFLPTH